MQYDFAFTLTAETKDQRELLNHQTGELAKVARVSVLADAEDELPNVYRFSGRIESGAATVEEARDDVLGRIGDQLRPQDQGLRWPPDDFELSYSDVPLRGMWLFEDLPRDRQLWLVDEAQKARIQKSDTGFDLVFTDSDGQTWAVEVKAHQPGKDQWRLLTEGLRQFLSYRSKAASDDVANRHLLDNPPEAGSPIEVTL